MRRAATCRWIPAVALLLAGCTRYTGQHWDEVRQTVIEPINTAVHRHLPRDITTKNMDAVLAMYTVENGSGLTWSEPIDISQDFTEQRLRWSGATGEEPLRARYEKLFGAFDVIERAELRIHRVYFEQRAPNGYPADVRRIESSAVPYVVRVGGYASREQAESAREALARKGFKGFIL